MDLQAVLRETADAIRTTLEGLDDWQLAGTRPGQYRSDLAADRVAVEILTGHRLGVLSEESGRHHPERDITVVLDPLDGSTNASRRIPWFATSLCAVDSEGPLAAIVLNLIDGTRFEAVRGQGSTANDLPIASSGRRRMRDSLVALSGFPSAHLGWNQYRALGAAALDLCAVASGAVDAYIDCSDDAHGPWDYLGALLVCSEAGAPLRDLRSRSLLVLDPDARRTPIAAATDELLQEALRARRSLSP